MKFSEWREVDNYFGTRIPKPSKSKKKEFTIKDYIKFQKEMDEFNKWKEDQEKLKKKEDKKPENKSQLSPIQTTILLTFSTPFIAGAYFYTILYGFRMIADAVGVK